MSALSLLPVHRPPLFLGCGVNKTFPSSAIISKIPSSSPSFSTESQSAWLSAIATGDAPSCVLLITRSSSPTLPVEVVMTHRTVWSDSSITVGLQKKNILHDLNHAASLELLPHNVLPDSAGQTHLLSAPAIWTPTCFLADTPSNTSISDLN